MYAEVPDGAMLASCVSPRAQHVISYHVVAQGEGWGGLVGETPVRLEAGDVLVLPRGDAYFISTSSSMRPRQDLTAELTFLREMAAGRLPFVVTDGGGGLGGLQLVCGFLGCDLRPFNPLLAAACSHGGPGFRGARSRTCQWPVPSRSSLWSCPG